MKKVLGIMAIVLMLVTLSVNVFADAPAWSQYLSATQVQDIQSRICDGQKNTESCKAQIVKYLGKLFDQATYGSNAKSDMIVTSNADLNASTREAMKVENIYYVEARDKYGNLKWEDVVINLVPEAGLTKYLDAVLKTGLALNGGCTASTDPYACCTGSGTGTCGVWYVGLVTGPGSGTTFADADTLATHTGWTEDTTSYTGNRPAFITSAAITCTGSGSCSLTNSANKASFTIDSTCAGGCTIAGALLCSAASGTSGTLMGAGDFTGGDRSVVESDTVNVTVVPTVAKP